MPSAYISPRATKSGVVFVVRYRLGGRESRLQHAGTFSTLRQAEEWRDRVSGQIAAGNGERAPKISRGTEDYVYFARFDGLIKIGVSRDPERRCRNLNAELLATIPGGRVLERELHETFARFRVRGEWFRADRILLRYIRPFQSEAAA